MTSRVFRSGCVFAPMMLLLGACAIDDGEVPIFGRACEESEECGEAHRCVSGACVPADVVADPGLPDAGPDPLDAVVVDGDLHPQDFALHPGVTRVTGDVLVVESDVRDLAPLVTLKKIDGHLRITGNLDLSRVTLPALTTIGGDVIVSNNAQLSRIESEFLQTTGNVQVDNNPALTTLGLQRLATVNGSFRLFNDDVLTLLALGDLATVTGALEIGFFSEDPENPGVPFASGNAQLARVELPKLTSVGAHAHVVFNEALETLDVRALASVGHELRIDANGALEELALPALTSVGVGVVVVENGITALSIPSLAAIEAGTTTPLTELFGPEAGALNIDRNAALESVDLSSLALLDAELSLTSSNALNAVEAPALATLGGLFLAFNPTLVDWPLPALTTCCGGNLMQIEDNGFATLPALEEGAGLTVIDGDLHFAGSRDFENTLRNAPFFAAVTAIRGDLYLHGFTLFDVTAFDALETIKGTVFVRDINPGVAFTIFPRLTVIGVEATRIETALQLSGLTLPTLPALTEVNGGVLIENSGGFALPVLGTIHGELRIEDNQAELAGLCGLKRSAPALHVKQNLVVQANGGLVSLAGLEGLDVDGTFAFNLNPALETCAVRDFATRHPNTSFIANKNPNVEGTCPQPTSCD